MSAALHRAWFEELIVSDQRERVTSYFSRIHKLDQTLLPKLPAGPEGVSCALAALAAISKDWYVTIHDQIERADVTLTRFSAYGTLIDNIGAISANEQFMTLTGMLWSRFADGRAYESIFEVSALEMLRRLDGVAIPATAYQASLDAMGDTT